MNLKKILPVFFIGAIASLLIFFRFNQIPSQLAFDEVEFAKIALSLDNNPYTPYVTTAYGHSTPYFYIILFFFKLFGVSSFALRLPAALFGVMSGLLVYYFFKRLTKSEFIAITGALLLVTQRWFYSFARFSFEATFLLFLELCSLLFFVHFLSGKKKLSFIIWSSVFAGFAFLSYYPGRIFFLLPVFILLIQKRFGQIGIFFIGFFIIISPLLFYYRTHPDTRIGQLLILTSSQLKPSEKVGQIAENVKRNILHLYLNQGDMNGRHNYPGKAAVNSIVTILFTIGVVIGLKQFPKLPHLLHFIFLGIALLPPILVFTYENPNLLRSFTSLVPIAYFSATGLHFLYKKFSTRIGFILVVVLLLFSAAYDARTYFKFQSEVYKHSFEVICPLPRVLNMKPDTLAEIPIWCRTHKPEDLLKEL